MANGNTTEQSLREINDRCVRIESRMVQLGDHVGANLRTKQRIEIRRTPPDGPRYVEIDSLDVSVSRILTELRQHGVNERAVDVYHDDQCVFTLFLHPKDSS